LVIYEYTIIASSNNPKTVQRTQSISSSAFDYYFPSGDARSIPLSVGIQLLPDNPHVARLIGRWDDAQIRDMDQRMNSPADFLLFWLMMFGVSLLGWTNPLSMGLQSVVAKIHWRLPSKQLRRQIFMFALATNLVLLGISSLPPSQAEKLRDCSDTYVWRVVRC
jgi:hypothetical protein